MSVQELQKAIQALEPNELDELLQWASDYYHAKWDAQIEADLAAGRLDHVLDEVRADIEAGRIKPL